MSKIPGGAHCILVAIAAGTFRGGNDLRSIDALVRRGLVLLADRNATLADEPRYSHKGRGIQITDAGAAYLQSERCQSEIASLRAKYPQT